ncbi:MAG: hypothetical protein FWG82_01515 [Oscillospiraceae bacterium]|nr:hypothetical protein [Oscillospiraceae bacterium]
MATTENQNKKPRVGDIKERLTSSMSIHDGGFALEYFGYNFTASGLAKKVYVYPPSELQDNDSRTVSLDGEKLNLFSSALNSKFLSSFRSERYSLFDVSFRESGCANSIGFSFNDIMDFDYIEPEKIFQPFENCGISFIGDVVKKLQANIFLYHPKYNPVFMFGLVINNTNLECAKGFVRFDQAEAPTAEERESIIERIVKTINHKDSCVKLFTSVAKKLERLGLTFAFVGVDCYINGSVRFKLYFRCYGERDLAKIAEEVSSILSQFGLSGSVQDVFSQPQGGVAAIALSSDSFEDINGVQLYFYP